MADSEAHGDCFFCISKHEASSARGQDKNQKKKIRTVEARQTVGKYSLIYIFIYHIIIIIIIVKTNIRFYTMNKVWRTNRGIIIL